MRRRITALLVVLTLLVGLPTSGLRRCRECPVDCPMHTANATVPKAHKPHCHEGAAHHAASSGPCMRRAACGHTAPELLSAVPGVLPIPTSVIRHALVTQLAPIEPRFAGLADPEPATGPPRASVRWV